MQPSGRAMQSMLNRQKSQTSLEELQNGHQIHAQSSHFDPTQSSHDDFLEQMLSALPSGAWPPELSNDLTDDDRGPSDPEIARSHQFQQSDDLPSPLSSKPRQHLIGGGADSPTSAVNALMLQQQLLFSRGLLPMPLSLGGSESFDFLQDDAVNDSAFKSLNPGDENSVQALYNGFAGSLKATGQTLPHFLNPQNFGAPTTATNQTSAGGSVGGSPAQPRQRARARRGQATDPHSIAERLRRERIAERMKSLQELVPNANKTDKASMLDEIIDYVKFLQLQVKVLSMSRLGGGGAVGPFAAAAAAADISSEASGGVRGRSSNGTQTASAMNDGMSVAEHQVAKLMEEDMGSAMQYLQGKGLCLMPISLATAISTATCHSRNPPTTSTNPLLVSGADSDCGVGGGGGPPSPSVSALTAQSATTRNGGIEDHVKDAASVSNP